MDGKYRSIGALLIVLALLVCPMMALAAQSGEQADDLALMNELVPGDYKAVESSYEVDAKKYGSVLFAAEDERTLVMKIQSSNKVNYKHSSDTGWPSAEPAPYVMLIAIDKAEKRVAQSSVLVDGTNRPEYFTVPEDRYAAYQTVVIEDETAFDAFTDGLVYDLDVELSEDSMGMSVITGTSIIFTGVSDDGTFSAQLVRHCYQTAARYFMNYNK